MKNNALKTAGAIFGLMAAAQVARFTTKLQVVAGGMEIPVWMSAVAALILLALAAWMFKAAAK